MANSSGGTRWPHLLEIQYAKTNRRYKGWEFFWEDRADPFAGLAGLALSRKAKTWDGKRSRKWGRKQETSGQQLHRGGLGGTGFRNVALSLYAAQPSPWSLCFRSEHELFILPPECLAPNWTPLNWNSTLVFSGSWFDTKKGTWMKPPQPSVHFQYVFGSLGKSLLTGWGKIYSIPKCHLQRAQLSQKNIYFFKSLFSFLGLNKESAISESNLWDLKLKHWIQYILTFM